MFLVTTDTQLGAVVVAPACAEVVDDKALTAIDGAGFVWGRRSGRTRSRAGTRPKPSGAPGCCSPSAIPSGPP